ncbi:MAG: hypothetical protein K6A73_01045 [Bacteroidales bacterium]|nr:hypothetical protein [Bacteroidales bacterium]
MYWIFLIPTLFLVLLAVAAIGIKSIVKKNGRFERKCAHSLDPDAKCVCGGDGECHNKTTCHSERSEEPHST